MSEIQRDINQNIMPRFDILQGPRVNGSRTTHGWTGTPEYRTWKDMRRRCYNPGHRDSKYSEKGVVVCDRWRDSFENFIMDMGRRPDGMSLERIDNSGDYTPENCRWADRYDQANNKDTTLKIEYKGKTYTARDLAKLLGVSRHTVAQRIQRGWHPERIIKQPYGMYGNRHWKQKYGS